MNAETEMEHGDGLGGDPRRDEANQAELDAATAPDEFDPGGLRDWLDELDAVEINALMRRVVGEDRIDAEQLRSLMREVGVTEEEEG